MLVKLDQNMLALVGATSAAEFPEKLSAFAAQAKQNETAMAESKVTLETLQASLTALEGKLLTEDRVKAIVSESIGAKTTEAIAAWAGSDAGKKIIGAESSRIAMEALANVGTQPAKPSPAPAAGESSDDKAKALIAEGKFKEAYALLPAAEKKDFVSAASYEAYMKARRRGAVQIKTKN